jgi:hypothetical protein
LVNRRTALAGSIPGHGDREEIAMRFMVIIKANADSEAGVVPSEKLINEMGKFNAQLEKAGVLRAGEGLTRSSQGARVSVRNGEKTVTDGPFAETKELVAGFWIIDVADLAEAIEWVKRAPEPEPGQVAEYEVRRVAEPDDFGDAFTPEARAAEDRLRARLAELD